ncbi:MAG TPA: hypothetical protein VM845_01965 [Burkholderiaceae bacterium]|nr:hypothetical protein [Burkholderiaceae bacterium]
MPALLNLVVNRPQLLTEHAEAYAALVASEVSRWSALWQRRALLRLLAAGSALVGVVLAGVALMLWSALPAVPAQAAWALLGVPLLPLALALACLLATPPAERSAFDVIRQQVDADLALLRQATGP